jgi:hypothetical protein
VVELAKRYGRYGYRRVTALLRDAGRPVQQRVPHRAADLIERGVRLGDIDQAALGFVQRKPLRLDL